MKKPIGWYLFRWECDQHEYRDSNVYSEEEKHDCKRGNRPRCDRLSCRYNVCPLLKRHRRKIKDGLLKEPIDIQDIADAMLKQKKAFIKQWRKSNEE